MAFLATLATGLVASKPFEGNEKKQDGGTKITSGTGSEQVDLAEGSKHIRHRFIHEDGYLASLLLFLRWIHLTGYSPVFRRPFALDPAGRSEHKQDTGASLHPAGNHSFILDSGCSIHATGNLCMLSEFTIIEPQGSDVPVFSGSNGGALPIAGVGSIAFGNFQISNVHYVPGLRSESTRVSVPLLAERDYLVMFGGGSCYVKDRAGGRLRGSGRMNRDDGCYHLEFLQIPPAAVQQQS